MKCLLSGVRALCVLAAAMAATSAWAQQAPAVSAPATDERFGGVHELNFYVGHSWHAGPVLGFVRNVTYTTVVARYSYDLVEYPLWTFRWAPEVTILADLNEPSPSPNNIHTNVPTRSNGAGLSPANLQGVFFPKKRIQPFLNADGGFLLYNQPVLSDGGTKFMFTVDVGLGANIYINRHDAVNVGFRYQHQSNADIGLHNPGADSEIFCFGVSHFFNVHGKGKAR